MSNRAIRISLRGLTVVAAILGGCFSAIAAERPRLAWNPVHEDFEQLTAGPGVPGLVTIRSFRVVEENGDLDGFADTNETVQLFVTVRNGTGHDVSNLVATLDTRDPKIGCILDAVATLEFFAAGAEVELPTPFRVRVDQAANRAGASVVCVTPGPSGHCSNFVPGVCASNANCVVAAAAEYAAHLDLHFVADQFLALARQQEIVLDLDLNVSVPVAATGTFAEGFESGLGNFQFQNLDASIASNALSNGRRCQYNDPDYPNSNTYADTECYLGFIAGQTPVNAWHNHSGAAAPDGGRAYLGARSLHYGTHTTGNAGLDTTMLSQMDAVRTISPLALAPRICAADPSPAPRACNVAADCVAVGGGPCVPAIPTVSFAQQISIVDSRSTNTPIGEAADRATFQVGLLGGSFHSLAPYENVYDVQGTDAFSNCIFDPIDDGNNEDAYYEPTDPARRFGPSSTCFPEFVFAYLGDTTDPFLASNLGRASDGPGLQGSLGLGTWVESKFDLSRYRGRQIHLRFLFTSIKVSDLFSMEAVFMWNPTAADDGWYVNNFQVSGTVASVTATTDDVDNSALPSNNDCDGDGDLDGADNCRFLENPVQEDLDGDGRGDFCDNCPAASNPSQTDVDHDGIGDACDPCPRFSGNYDGGLDPNGDPDADGRGNACDNCPFVINPDQSDQDADRDGDVCDSCILLFNPEQSDFDHDGEGDVCDLDDGNIQILVHSRTTIEWQDEQGPEGFNVYEGALDVLRSTGVYTQLPGSNTLAERHCAIVGFVVADPGGPPSGMVGYSLVTGITGGVEGGLGTNSAGTPRPNTNPCP